MIEFVGYLLIAAFLYAFYTAHKTQITKTSKDIEDIIK